MVAAAQQRRDALMASVPVWERRTVGAHFEKYCKMFADRMLLITPTGSYSYAHVWQQSWRVAKALLAIGVKRRQHVAIVMSNEVEHVALALACSLVGAVAVPINTMLREEELAYTLWQSDSQYLFLHETVGNQAYAKIVAAIMQPHPDREPVNLRAIVCVPTSQAELPDGMIPWQAFVDRSKAVTDAAVTERFHVSEYPDEVADIIYTSGSTGMPKGVMITHEMWLRCGFSTALSRGFEDGRRVFTGLPMYHVFAKAEGLLAASFVGGAIITTPGFSPLRSLEMIAQHQANDVLCVPSMLVALVNHPQVEQFDLGSLYALMCAAAPAPVPVWRKAIDVLGLTEICTGYGGTEATAATVHTEIGDPIDVVVSRVGRIKPGGSSGLPEFGGKNVQYKVIDPFTSEDLPEDAIGELAVRGNLVTRGYYHKPDETAYSIDKDGWFHTGDLGRIDERGYLEFLGRSKDVYKVSGENVAPKEVEDVITRLESVAQAYVVGVPDALTTEAGAAFVELKSGASCTRREVIAWCQNHLARFKVPRHVFFVEASEWPMTGTGKIQKFKLRDMAKERLGIPIGEVFEKPSSD